MVSRRSAFGIPRTGELRGALAPQDTPHTQGQKAAKVDGGGQKAFRPRASSREIPDRDAREVPNSPPAKGGVSCCPRRRRLWVCLRLWFNLHSSDFQK